eukprot:TRINITY_DN2524_c0_g1_i1.p1 TRINITY_DN2524_c0_g1~~TRINITY_DN2524_c0_g1_i1.p1  ORF type:complete len:161 (-),score=29.71 TRINITY_DN2524_c0_g1_i1:221-703(-)
MAVQLLLKEGVPVDATNRDKRTALHLAAFQGHQDVAALLLRANAYIAAEDADGYNAEQLADRQRELKAADPKHTADIGGLIRQHADFLEREKNIRLLQSQARGFFVHENRRRGTGTLPPIAVSPVEDARSTSMQSLVRQSQAVSVLSTSSQSLKQRSFNL